MTSHNPVDTDAQKRALRTELRQRRSIRTFLERERSARSLTQELIGLARRLNVSSLAAYASTPDEPETGEFLTWALQQDIRVLLPVSRDDGLLDWFPYTGRPDDLARNAEITTELLGPIAIGEVDLILAPAACVARNGMRMGWGRGYFDRTLGSMENRPPVYAVVFDDEIVDRVPTELHDVPVDGAITPSGVTVF